MPMQIAISGCSCHGFGSGEMMGTKMMAMKLNYNMQFRSKSNIYLNSDYHPLKYSISMSTPTTISIDAASDNKSTEARTVVAVILGGGARNRLFPLTNQRAKSAVPIGGSYRLIDIPMSNCINSGINKVYILTHFNSASLNRHLARAYNFGNGVNFGNGFVEVLAATQTSGESGNKWFQGSADAVRQFHWLFEDVRGKEIEDVLILNGDHIYRMDYMDLIQSHRQSGADITISGLPVDKSRALENGLMKTDEKGRVISFKDKPRRDDLMAMKTDDTEKKPYTASMGVYVFKKDILLNLLRWRFPTANDFASEIIPASVKEFFVKAYIFNDYWEDIKTIKSFFNANLALTQHPPRFSFYDEANPIFTSRRNLPSSEVHNSKIMDSIISHGSFLKNCCIEHSVVGIRSRISNGVHLKDTVMIGADYYETDAEIAALVAHGSVPIGIGENTKIKDCIIDKNARIGKNVTITNSQGIEEADRRSQGFYIRSGITVIPKNSTIADNLVI
ncbi:Glucose-1-phosphate adenylyltransferase [Zostera marina]|uniref:glucose-1-phosphate adenylyltransferase n=1 Tax=Zostera marina TaxID=29655 RepID=A0A0K9PKQ2_ZOSMR|nr:Glucose-1-phosphate adenylyltransferase [Zostera marina]